jgi:DNA repair exonuclease SbcCD ATPase subunit
MDILKLHIENFLTIGQADLELDNRGLLLIQGKNNDDTSASSNGAGKSSIVDALCWAIYGTTARGVSGDEVVNDQAKKDCCVKVTLDDGGTVYVIERYRKHAKQKDQLFVFQAGVSGSAPVSLHKGTARETQEVILKVMGCSLEVFKGSIYAGQEQMPDLPGMTDKQLKLLVEEAAGVEELAEAHQLVQKDCLGAEKALAVATTELANLGTQHVDAVNDLADAQDQEKLFEDGRKDRARTELAKVTPLLADLTTWRTNVTCFDEPGLTKRKGEIEALLTGLKGEQDERTRLQGVLTAAQRLETTMRAALATTKANLDAAKRDLANVGAKVGSPCGECGKAYCEHDIEGVRKMREQDVTDHTATTRHALTKAQSAIAAAKDAQEALDTHVAGMTDVTAISSELKWINDSLADLAKAQAKVEALQKDIEDVKTAAKAKLTEPNTWTPHVAARKKKADDLLAKIKTATEKVEKLEAEHELLADAVKVFGPAGVRAHILDTVTPFLNAQTGEYLGTLADGNIHATWSTLSTTAKGELKEKFNIAVTNDKGGKSFALQSGGEKRKVRLSTALALQDMVASRASKPINLFMADEIDDALDGPGLERLMTVLDRKAKERGTVLVISHNALTDWIDSVITVEKTGGKSTVGGSNVRSF